VKHKLYQIDAFTDTIFGGNPACVLLPLGQKTGCQTKSCLENCKKRTAVAGKQAFFVDKGEKNPFTMVYALKFEMDLCGHV